VIENANNQNVSTIPTLSNLLVHAKDEDTGAALNYEQIVDNMKVFYFAGHETTATLITATFYYLMRNPEITKKLQAEIDSVLAGIQKITLEHIEKLIYLQCVLKETLRIRPSVPFIGRETIEDVQIGKYFVPKGIKVFISFDLLHHKSSYWENPHEYIPERWLTLDDTKVRSDGYYIPFGAGPRICIGQRLAREEALVYVALILKNFDLVPPANYDKNKPIDRIGLNNIKDVNVILTKRNL